jgi:hypothetical protein
MEHIGMRKGFARALLTAGATLALTLAVAPAALADGGGGHGGGNGGGNGGSGRPGGPPVTASGTGTLGTGWTLKSMHDDNAAGAQIVGEEFEIDAPAGQTWNVTFADNGVTFFSAAEVTAAGGVTINSNTPNQAGTQDMTATAVNPATGEQISAAVELPAISSSGGHGN